MSVLNSDSAVRLEVFLGVLVVMALAEALVPRRRWTVSKPWRWTGNLGLALLNTLVMLVMRAVLPLGAVGTALVAQERGWGLLNNMALPDWVVVVLAVIALDRAIYFQHVLFHAGPTLWRLHLVHHADLDFDVSTGLRFHTLELLLSLGIKLAAVVLLGAPAPAVLFFEVLLNATSIFNHANLRLPEWLDRLLRLVLVTPDMHRVHHSVIESETNSNFGFTLPRWDYLFGTYRAQPVEGHEGMTVGLAQFRDQRVERLAWMLALPFMGRLGNDPFNRNGESGDGRRPVPLATRDSTDN